MRITALWKQHGNTRLKRPPHFISSFSEVPSSFNWSIYIPSQNSVKQQKRVNGVDRRQDDKRKVCGIESAWRENASSQEFREKTKSDWPETLLLKTGHIFERKTEKKRERIWLPEGGFFLTSELNTFLPYRIVAWGVTWAHQTQICFHEQRWPKETHLSCVLCDTG